MAKSRAPPLLPVHSVRAPKRSRRKGFIMRLVIFCVIVFCVGYAAFAAKYVGSSKHRKALRDKIIRTQLSRKPSATLGGVEDGASEGRTLKEDGTARLGGHDGDPAADRFAEADDGAYDDVVAQDGADAQQQQHPASDPTHSSTTTTTAGGGSGRGGAPVVAGPTETDRAADEKGVVAPSLATGSRIEPDSAAAHPTVVEPGASPVVTATSGHTEPALERRAVGGVPITTAHVEPEHVVAPAHHQPAPVVAPRETDSSVPTTVHRAPEDGAPAGGGGGGSHTAAVGGSPPPAVVAPHTVQAVPTPAPVQPAAANATAGVASPWAKGLYAMEAVDIDGRPRKLSEFAGKVTLVVNVASACGYTDENYKGLTKTYDKYRAHGFEILGFPCNQFGKQEPGSEADIKSFCSTRYHVGFPMFSKVDVNGPHTHPVYAFLKRELPEAEGGGGGKAPGRDLVWNFNKFLVNHEGRPVKMFFQGWNQGAVEQEIYRLLHEGRAAGAIKPPAVAAAATTTAAA
ncbi:Phospholipid hydroperoxide glutathione peroxidase 1, chloroplastic [Tetrabaena socialis]|uniref:Glutathione peroxidase n=1 Tax=Tetrabaena socialis TaxID=47790 RepID=A0A2J7ZQZ5_9CHLO|nr:Phospholipid hydroperoxide glutathione peroxidase 1, chloroplastic [Tetrabaena socialis]|eukprot:PNH02689.1 Phospholipid hydroperoxide glutathione peroxidase 1, chloroplastic [Tetrabaena socialis]